jgi:hypothetical protein
MAVFNKKIYPLVNYPSGPYPFCINPSSPSVAVFPIISNNSSDYIYNWTGPPASSLSNYNTPTITVTGIGIYTVVVTNTLNGCSTKGQIIVANCYTGLNEFGYNSAAFSVYPNPIENKFTLEYNQNETAELEIQIHTISGELIHKEKMREQKIQVNSETYCSGIYFLHVKKNGSIIYTTKLIRK